MDMTTALIEMLKDTRVADALREILAQPHEVREDELLNTEQLKEYTGIKETSTFCKWQKAGLPYIKGNPNLYFKRDVINFLKNKRIIFNGRVKGIGEGYKTTVRVRQTANGSECAGEGRRSRAGSVGYRDM